MFEKFNLTNTIREGVDISEMEFKPLSDFAGMKVKVEGFYFNNKGFFGEQLVVIGNGYQINMPKRAVKDFKEIANNKTMLNAVLSGHLTITDISIKEDEVFDEEIQAKVKKVTPIYNLKDC